MDSPLHELGRQLLQSAEASLLDLALDALCTRIADEDVRDVLTALYEAGEGATLRHVLCDDRLARWAGETCTTREEHALSGQLRKWLGTGAAAGDDAARLAPVEPVPEDAGGLFSWAERHRMTRELMRPAHEVLPLSVALAREASLADLCLGALDQGTRGASLLAQLRAGDEARAYLRGQAAERAALPARQALHQSPLPAGPLGALARRLRAYGGGTELAALQGMRFVPARPVTIELASGIAHGALKTEPTEAPAHVALYLSGYEQRALDGTCDRCAAGAPCLHVRALAARLLDAVWLVQDRLHPALVELVAVPSWQRFLHALSPPSARTEAPLDSLWFSLRMTAGRVTVAVLQRRGLADGKTSTGKLVSAQKVAQRSGLCDHDQAVLAALRAGTRTLVPQYIPADLTILRALVEHPRVQLDREGAEDSTPLRVTEERLHIELVEQPEGLLPKLTLGGAPVRPAERARDAHYLAQHDKHAAKLVFAPLTPALERLLSAVVNFRGLLPPASYPQLAPWIGSLRSVAHVSTPKALDGMERPAPTRLLLRITPLLDQGVDVTLTVRALPLAPLWSPGHGPELVHGLIDGVPCSVRRELERERALAEHVVTALSLREHLELAPGSHRIESTQASLELLSRAARLHDQLELEWAERARPLRITATVRSTDLKVALFKKGDWCGLTGGAQRGDVRVAVERLLEAARTGERFVVIEGSDYLEIEQTLFERLDQAQLVMAPLERELSLPAAGVHAWLDQFGAQTAAGDAASAAWLLRARSELSNDQPSILNPQLTVELRAYQQRGVDWLVSRSKWAPGVCLADDMGLGKTVQTIALLAERQSLGPALVVAPTSVVDGWLSELRRFAPQLTPLLYRGPGREGALAALGAGTVLVTSYELVLRDLTRFGELSFSTLVVDEAQVVKNARTLRARAVASLQADFRVALSGTPVENRLGDLWSLFHLIAPGLLGSWARFRARFAVPIERYENEERARVLRALVSPFMLRRTKREVLAELPPRTEVVHLVELSQAEQDLYNTALAHARQAVGKRRRNDNTRTVQILAELTRLRQLACHPRLVLEDSRVTSSKLATLVLLLEDILPRGHRVLIFSQFVRHLSLVQEQLERLSASYVMLDGSTPAAERAERVATFQRGDCQVFLISLKAGGTGLNLTAADYVVHMDPWWNPSVEDQASDRAHRIGQQRPVTVVKLVAQGTIEERVLGLHEHKRRLARLVIDDAEGSPDFDVDTLERLLDE